VTIKLTRAMHSMQSVCLRVENTNEPLLEASLMTQSERLPLKTSIERHMAARRAATAHGEGNIPANGTLAREKLLRSTMECKTYALAADSLQHGSYTAVRMS